MTPGARVAAAIEVLDQIADGRPAEQALTRWARGNRFAGSKDRAAIRDHVFDVLRQKRRAAAVGGGQSGRALMIGALRLAGADLASLFDGQGYGPAPITPDEIPQSAPLTQAEEWDLPDWLVPLFQDSLGDDAGACAKALQQRAPITLRVNLAKTTRDQAIEALTAEGIDVRLNPLSDAALSVTQGARKIRNSTAFTTGLIELQDAASQAVVQQLPQGGRVLDYCAGGGGKALALAMTHQNTVFAHDIDPARMQDLPTRTLRAGAQVTLLETQQIAGQAPFDLVLCDAPCSGSGAWRRAPEGKWTLTPERLDELTKIQDDVLTRAMSLTAPGGVLAYATCSVLSVENTQRIDAFLARNLDWTCRFHRQFLVGDDGDGFFAAHLTRA